MKEQPNTWLMGLRFMQIYFTWFHVVNNKPEIKMVRSLDEYTEATSWFDILPTWVWAIIIGTTILIIIISCYICRIPKIT